MMRFGSFTFILIILSAMVFISGQTTPVTGLAEPVRDQSNFPSNLPSLNTFISSVKNEQSDLLTGVFVPKVMAFPIVQQPQGEAGFVSSQSETLTQFRMAQQYHSIGLLAHDFLAGTTFPFLKPGFDVILVYGNGTLEYYQVVEVKRYQALSPASPYSKFVDLETRDQLSAEQLFFQTYGKGGSTLIFQTCISTDNVPSWGRLFVLARPREESQPSLVQALPLIEQALLGARQSLRPLKSEVALR